MKKRAKKIIIKKKRGIIGIALTAFLVLALSLYLIRAFGHTEIDDVSPGIECSDELIDKSDILWVIPVFHNKSIAEDREWCEKIIALNKTLGLHGVYHEYNEFGSDKSKEYIDIGAREFKKCFGFYPAYFKAPQLNLTSNNKETLIEMRFDVRGEANQLLHKVYHCSDTGVYSNKFIDYF